MTATDPDTPNGPSEQDHPNGGPAVDRVSSRNSTTLSLSAGNSIEHSPDSTTSNTHHGQGSHAGSSQLTKHDDNDFNPADPPQVVATTTSSDAVTNTVDVLSTHLSSARPNTDPDMNMSDVKLENPTSPHDPALDEDAPHEDDDEGSDSESAFINLRTGRTFQDGSIDSNLSPNYSTLHSWSHPQPSNHHEIDQKPGIPPTTDHSSARKRKRTSDQNGTTATPSRRESSRPKQTPRVKSAEQLEREALIEQQNPHASKNELRSLKLRALHAIRIAERELNMPEAEKQRRLRLREYVRQKRSEERSLKNSGKQTTAAGAELKARNVNSRSRSSSRSTKTKKEIDLPHAQEKEQATNSRPPFPASHLNQSQPVPTPSAPSVMNSSTDHHSAHNGHSSGSKRKATKNCEKTPKGKSTPRVKRSVASLEAEIKKRNPNASPNQLKSLKLRALHADRIAEREQNMSEKDKVRRAKLREYMRRRREEERVERGQEPTELSLYDEAKVAADSTSRYRRSLDSSTSRNDEGPVHPNDGSMSELMAAAPLVPEGMNADDRLAAFSMMELTNNYQHQYVHSHQPHGPSTNLHLHPLFQMPMGQSSIEGPSPYDCSIHAGYAPMTEQWSHVPPPDAHLPTDEVGEKALHAALEEAIYTKPHHHQHQHQHQHQQHHHHHHPHHHHHHQISLGEHHHPHYSPHEQSLEADTLSRMEQERIQLAEDEILGIERARELAMIAAAAAEVEHAQHISASTSSHHLR